MCYFLYLILLYIGTMTQMPEHIPIWHEMFIACWKWWVQLHYYYTSCHNDVTTQVALTGMKSARFLRLSSYFRVYNNNCVQWQSQRLVYCVCARRKPGVHLTKSSQTRFFTLKSILIFNIDLEYLKQCQHHNVPAGHWHWCAMEIVSTII